MSLLKDPRDCKPIRIKHRQIRYSRWPVARTTRRYGLQSVVFASSPWGIIKDSIRKECVPASRKEALAYIDQAREYFNVATEASTVATKPVLIYYSFLNLAKAFILTTGTAPSIPNAKHGLSEYLPSGGKEVRDSFVVAYRTKAGATEINIFDKFMDALHGAGLPSKKRRYDVKELLPQVLQGHRMWCRIWDERERFVSLRRLALKHDDAAKEMWICIEVYADDLTRLGLTRKRFLAESGLASQFREVKSEKKVNGRRVLVFEQKNTTSYTGRPSDKLQDLVDTVSDSLWTNVLSIPPYRKYYTYGAPTAAKSQVVPQLLSIYMLFFYFGSVTRYRPHTFAKMMEGKYSAQLREIMTDIPIQFLYLLASEFASQDVVRAAII